MKLPPFTLVYRPRRADAKRESRERRLIPELKGQVTELKRQTRVETVGFWDLASQVGELPRAIEALNRVQPVFTFFEVQAAVPSGLISRPERVVAWAKERSEKPLSEEQIDEIDDNLIFEDFAQRARKVRRQLGIDHLIGIVPSMIAFEENGDLFWNYFTMSEKGLVLASTFDIFGFAREASRPFEVAVAGIALATLLARLNPDLEFHEENRGCLFDFNRERASIVESLRRSEIEPSCLAKIRPKYREAVEVMVAALRELGKAPKVPAPRRRKEAAMKKGTTAKDSGEPPAGEPGPAPKAPIPRVALKKGTTGKDQKVRPGGGKVRGF